MLRLYNTLTKKKEAFQPRKDKEVDMFVCGPTVYDYSHVGHARTYVFFDIIVKYLRKRGFDVFYVQNITDVDDKIIKRAQKTNTSWNELARKFESEYLKDMGSLKIDSVNKYAKATEHVPEIISQVKRLLENDFAYKISDGVYYDISKFQDYGKLSGRTATMAEDAVSRIDESKEKRNKGDFCLWKFSKPNEPKWKSPWGMGRPGWHIEDTAITEKFLGPQYDIHGGARDLIFPHHEAEISQMEAISNKKPFVRYWLHTGFLTIENKKMSKSLGNFVTIRDFLKNNSYRVLRLLIAKAHYRSPVDFNKKLVAQAKKEIRRMDEFVSKLQNLSQKGVKEKPNASPIVSQAKEKFNEAMDDDFNTPVALSSIFKLIGKGNKLIATGRITNQQTKDMLDFLDYVNSILSLELTKSKKIKVIRKIRKLAEEREAYRRKENWNKADEIRKKLESLGYSIKDTPSGPKIIKND